jgi:hypothetical protein
MTWSLQPGTLDIGADPGQNYFWKVGTVANYWTLSESGPNVIDAAISRTDFSQAQSYQFGIGEPNPVRAEAYIEEPVEKSGRTTGVTYGSVTSINVSVKVAYGEGCPEYDFVDQVAISGTPPPFSDHGDSGSAILDSTTLAPVALLFAGGPTTTFANNIGHVYDDLDVVPTLEVPSFTLSASPSSVTVMQGGSGTSTVTVTDQNGFVGTVGLVASGLPGGVTASFNPASTKTTSTLTLSASSSASTGTFTVTITGTAAKLVATTTLTLTVSAAGPETGRIRVAPALPPSGQYPPSNAGQSLERANGPELARLKEIQSRHEVELFAIPGVQAVGIGFTEGRSHLAFHVYVRLRTSELEAAIPQEIEGVPVRLMETGGEIQAQ